MLKKFVLLLSIYPSLCYASLWCSYSSNGLTPSETYNNMWTPYKILQLDIMSSDIIQIDITDNYNDTRHIFKAIVANDNALNTDKINGVAITKYHGISELNFDPTSYTREEKNDIEISLTRSGRIILKTNVTTFHCEVPGNYQPRYMFD